MGPNWLLYTLSPFWTQNHVAAKPWPSPNKIIPNFQWNKRREGLRQRNPFRQRLWWFLVGFHLKKVKRNPWHGRYMIGALWLVNGYPDKEVCWMGLQILVYIAGFLSFGFGIWLSQSIASLHVSWSFIEKTKLLWIFYDYIHSGYGPY